MNTTDTPAAWRPEYMTEVPTAAESRSSGVSWAAVIAGAFVAAAIGLILAVLGVGLGLSSVSPWPGAGVTATTIGVSAIVWLVVMHAISSGLGGYIAGRLRTKWTSIHDDEVFFRDTAHGFLVWAVGLVFSVAVLASATSSLLGATARVVGTAGGAALGAATAGGAALSAAATPTSAAGSTDARADSSTGGSDVAPAGTGAAPLAYLTDTLLRGEPAPAPSGANASGTTTAGTASAGAGASTAAPGATSTATASSSASARPELARIFAEAMRRGSMSDADRTYAARLVAAQTGISQADAEKRVDAVYTQAKGMAAEAEATARSVADDARKATARASLWAFVAALIGAFCASVAATVGGRQRDSVRAPTTRDRDHTLSRDARESVPAR